MDTFNSHPETFIVAESQGSIVGYIMCRMEHGFSDLKKLRFARKAHIISVAVMPEARRVGIASGLVKEALQNLHADECYLEVRVTNDAAIKLYENLGFQVARTIQRYYYDGSDAYVMAKELTQGQSVQPVRPGTGSTGLSGSA